MTTNEGRVPRVRSSDPMSDTISPGPSLRQFVHFSSFNQPCFHQIERLLHVFQRARLGPRTRKQPADPFKRSGNTAMAPCML